MLKDRLLVLDLVEEGKINVSEAVELIESINIYDNREDINDENSNQAEIVIRVLLE